MSSKMLFMVCTGLVKQIQEYLLISDWAYILRKNVSFKCKLFFQGVHVFSIIFHSMWYITWIGCEFVLNLNISCGVTIYSKHNFTHKPVYVFLPSFSSVPVVETVTSQMQPIWDMHVSSICRIYNAGRPGYLGYIYSTKKLHTHAMCCCVTHANLIFNWRLTDQLTDFFLE